MTRHEARCSCGALTVTADGDPLRNSVCHCLDCKRRTGSAFSWNATFAEAQVKIVGAAASHSRVSDEGFWGRHHFCPECGTHLFYAIERRPGMISIPVGAFADRDFPAPAIEVYDERRCPWLPGLAPIRE